MSDYMIIRIDILKSARPHLRIMFINFEKKPCGMSISLAFLPPNLTNTNKITYRQAAIDSSMPGEFKKCN